MLSVLVWVFFCCTLTQHSHLELSGCASCLVVEFMKHLDAEQVAELLHWYTVSLLFEGRV